MDQASRRLPLALLGIRVSLVIVMGVWVADKFVNWPHTAKVFEHFYGIAGLGETTAYVLGGLQGLVLLAFAVGYRQRLSYGLIAVMHTVSTLSSWQQYLEPWPGNLLFFAAWPMLAACWTLYALREADTIAVIDRHPA